MFCFILEESTEKTLVPVLSHHLYLSCIYPEVTLATLYSLYRRINRNLIFPDLITPTRRFFREQIKLNRSGAAAGTFENQHPFLSLAYYIYFLWLDKLRNIIGE
jgi:hypothetical protein